MDAHTLPAPYVWRRFTFAQRLARFLVYLAIVAAIIASVRTIAVIPEFLYDAPARVGEVLSRMWPVAWAHYPATVHDALMETVHIASLGTLLGLVLALPLGVLAAHNLVPVTPINLVAKLVLVSSRSVSSLVWALVLVAIFGSGAFAGTLAIALGSMGFVGKRFGDALEEAQPGPIAALSAAGAPWLSRVTYGLWPQVRPVFGSIALFRFDGNLRESAVLGLVGAGGIGMALDSALNLFQWDRVALILLAIVAVLVVAEIVVTQVRKRIL